MILLWKYNHHELITQLYLYYVMPIILMINIGNFINICLCILCLTEICHTGHHHNLLLSNVYHQGTFFITMILAMGAIELWIYYQICRWRRIQLIWGGRKFYTFCIEDDILYILLRDYYNIIDIKFIEIMLDIFINIVYIN